MSVVDDMLESIQSKGFDYYMRAMLARVPAGLDTREGSIIYDALAPAAMSMTEMGMNLANLLLNTYTQTAVGQFLDYRAAERGLSREPATPAQAVASIQDERGQAASLGLVPAGSRWSTVSADSPHYFQVTGQGQDSSFTLVAEEPGTPSNTCLGQILPVDNIDGLGYAQITALSVPGADEEDDDSLRSRVLAQYQVPAYGGNVADYLQMLDGLGTIGAAQVYPAWQGGGSVKLCVLDNQFAPAGPDLLAEAQAAIDPPDKPGQGYGLAPIGHTVSVVAPQEVMVDVSMSVQTAPDTSLTAVQPLVEQAVSDYLLSLRRDLWAVSQADRTYQLTVLAAKVLAACVQVPGITNVTGLTLNGQAGDLALQEDPQAEQLPVMGEVSLSA